MTTRSLHVEIPNGIRVLSEMDSNRMIVECKDGDEEKAINAIHDALENASKAEQNRRKQTTKPVQPGQPAQTPLAAKQAVNPQGAGLPSPSGIENPPPGQLLSNDQQNQIQQASQQQSAAIQNPQSQTPQQPQAQQPQTQQPQTNQPK